MNKEIKIEELSIENSAGYKNLIAIRDFVVKTRKEFRELQEEFLNLQAQVTQLKTEKNQLKDQVNTLQVRLYSQTKTK